TYCSDPYVRSFPIRRSSDLSFNQRHGQWLFALEWAFTAIFALEYLVRIYTHPEPRKYVFSFYGAIDLLSILPAFLALLFVDAQRSEEHTLNSSHVKISYAVF